MGPLNEWINNDKELMMLSLQPWLKINHWKN